MTGKRFTVIREVYQVYKDLTLYEVSDGTHTFLIYENAQELTDLLNELAEENKALKKQLQSEHTMLDNAILLERTRMGKNCLKQFRETIQ